MHRYYAVDLTGLWTGDLSIRKLCVLFRNLPPESATVSRLWSDLPDTIEMQEPQFQRLWSMDQELLAAVVDAVTSLRHAFIQVNSKKGAGTWEPVSRPGRKHVVTRVDRQKLDHIRRRNREGKRAHG